MTATQGLLSGTNKVKTFAALGVVGILFLSLISITIFYDEGGEFFQDIPDSIDSSARNNPSVQLVNGWSRTGSGGSGGQQVDVAYTVDIDDSNNIYVAGTFSGQDTFGTFVVQSSGGLDIFLGKISPTGDWLWVLTGGGLEDDYATAVTVDTSGNPIISGYIGATGTFGDNTAESLGGTEILVAKAQSSGEWSWVTTAGGVADDRANAISSGVGGSIFITGQVENDASFGPTSTTGYDLDAFVGAIGPSGNWNWVQRFSGNQDDGGYCIDVVDGNVISGGDHWGDIEINEMELSGGGGYISSMNTSTGSVNWLVDVQGTPNSMASDDSGYLYVAGYFTGAELFGDQILTSAGGQDVFLGKLNTEGENESNWIWAISAGSDEWDTVGDIAVNGVGQIVLIGTYGDERLHSDITVGSTVLANHEYSDVFVATASTGGNWIGAINGVSDSREQGLGIAVDSNDEVIAVGYFSGEVRDSLTFYDIELGTHMGGIEHMFVWKFMWDSDGDGIAAIYDNCPQGISDWVSNWQTDHDADGCFDATEDDDDDGDGLNDSTDLCERGYNAWTSNPQTDPNGDGCEDDHEGEYTLGDIDVDGVLNDADPDPHNPSIRNIPSHLYSNITSWPRGASQLCDEKIISCNDSPIKFGWFDFDGDGDLDYAAGGSVFRQVNGVIEPTSSWSEECSVTCGTAIAISDYNRDSKLDLSTSQGLYLSYENGLSQDAIWEFPLEMGVTVTDLRWHDLDKDGHDDVYLGTDSSADILRMSNGSGVITGDSVILNKSGITKDVRFADMNGDDWIDIVRFINNGGFDVFYNQNGVFTNNSNFSSGMIPSSSGMDIGDFDGDGEIDIAISTINGKEDYIYRNNITTSERTYTMDWNSLDGSDSTNVVVGDVDGDGDLDITFGSKTYLNPSGSISVDLDLDGILDVNELAVCSSVNNPPFGIWFSTTKLDYDSDGCHDLIQDDDDDGDGVLDDDDDCGRGQTNWAPTILTDFDEDGCNDYLEDEDDDNDGVLDTSDNCPNTDPVLVEYIDEDGCDPSSKDTDGDGYEDSIDEWDNDPTQWVDTDGDGYGDNESGTNGDSCQSIKGFSTVDRFGCPDSDGDGISNSGEYSGCEYIADCDNDGQTDDLDPCPLDQTNSCVGVDCQINPNHPDCQSMGNNTNNSNVTNNDNNTNNTGNLTNGLGDNADNNSGDLSGTDTSSESLFDFTISPELVVGIGIISSILILVFLLKLTKTDPDDWEDDDDDLWEEEQRDIRRAKMQKRKAAEKRREQRKQTKTDSRKSKKGKSKQRKEEGGSSAPSTPPPSAPPPSAFSAPSQTPTSPRPTTKPQPEAPIPSPEKQPSKPSISSGFKSPTSGPPGGVTPAPSSLPGETVVKKLKATAISRKVATTYGDSANDEGVYFKKQDSYWPTVDMQGAKADDGYEWLEYPEGSAHWWYRKQKGHEWGYWES